MTTLMVMATVIFQLMLASYVVNECGRSRWLKSFARTLMRMFISAETMAALTRKVSRHNRWRQYSPHIAPTPSSSFRHAALPLLSQ
jgi:hypothetical protein